MKKRRRAKNLSNEGIHQIVEIIDGWTGKISWNVLIDAIEIRLYSRYTRQALFKHERIRLAFDAVQQRDLPAVSGRKCKPRSLEVQSLEQQLARLRAENARLTLESDRLLEQFVRWAYNAFTRGLDEAFLNRPLPPINRRKTPDSESR